MHDAHAHRVVNIALGGAIFFGAYEAFKKVAVSHKAKPCSHLSIERASD